MKEKKLRVFEAFAGIGAQHSALKRANINFEIVGISEWFTSALYAYQAIHCDKKAIKIPSYDEQIKYLKKFTFSKDSVNPIKNIESLSKEEIRRLYIANKKTKNFGSICEIKGKDMPICDLLVYSFPCQDLSTGGKTLGMSKGSGTRSGLLWEVERILKELNFLNKLPEYLLLENVKTLYADSNKKDLDQWLDFLTSLGYKHGTKMVLNSANFGVPQIRKRAFIISRLNKKVTDKKIAKYCRPAPSLLPFLRLDYENPVFRTEANLAQLNRTPSREEMWQINRKEILPSTLVNTITCNMDRSNTSAMFSYNGAKGRGYRLLTSREAFLLMGFTEKEFEKAKTLDFSYRKLNKLIGNSIVVNVLVVIFEELFKEEFSKCIK